MPQFIDRCLIPLDPCKKMSCKLLITTQDVANVAYAYFLAILHNCNSKYFVARHFYRTCFIISTIYLWIFIFTILSDHWSNAINSTEKVFSSENSFKRNKSFWAQGFFIYILATAPLISRGYIFKGIWKGLKNSLKP